MQHENHENIKRHIRHVEIGNGPLPADKLANDAQILHRLAANRISLGE